MRTSCQCWLLVHVVAVVGSAYAQPAPDRRDAGQGPPAQAPLAVGGYCAVTLRDRRQWQPGDERTTAEFDGLEYRFAGPRQRDVFAASPTSYAPVLGGDCPVTFLETGERVAGRLEHGLLYGDRLLFFASRDAVLRFLDEPARYDDADLACDGRCAVSRIEGERDAPGIAETAVLHGGLRYLFASAFERSLFLQNPARYDGRGAEAVAPHPPTAARREPAPNATLKNPWRLPAGQGPGSSRATPEKEKFVLAAAPVMAGYCPVTIRRDGVWVRGRYDHRVELGEHLLLVAGPAERALFEADPAAYIPACLGDCPVTLVTRRERVRGSVFHALEYRGRLFLFADAQARAEFKASPDVYALADVAADGNCVVTQLDEQRAVPGLLHATAWYDGLLYRFAGDEQKRKFLAAPERYAAAVQPAADAGHQQPAVAQ